MRAAAAADSARAGQWGALQGGLTAAAISVPAALLAYKSMVPALAEQGGAGGAGTLLSAVLDALPN